MSISDKIFLNYCLLNFKILFRKNKILNFNNRLDFCKINLDYYYLIAKLPSKYIVWPKKFQFNFLIARTKFSDKTF